MSRGQLPVRSMANSDDSAKARSQASAGFVIGVEGGRAVGRASQRMTAETPARVAVTDIGAMDHGSAMISSMKQARAMDSTLVIDQPFKDNVRRNCPDAGKRDGLQRSSQERYALHGTWLGAGTKVCGPNTVFWA